MAFEGYTQETLDFLWGIRFNNERGWFMAHKEDYQAHLLRPTRELGEQVYEALHEKYPKEPFLLKMSRIYRDAGGCTGKGRTRIICGSASVPGTRTGRGGLRSILRSRRIITATAWGSGRQRRR